MNFYEYVIKATGEKFWVAAESVEAADALIASGNAVKLDWGSLFRAPSPNKRQQGSQVRRFIKWMAGLVRPKPPKK